MDKLEFECKTLSPLDGRYGNIKDALGEYFSEFALMKYRVKVEIKWLLFLLENVDYKLFKGYSSVQKEAISSIYDKFDFVSYQDIKQIEATTRHDVKAVEYFIDHKLEQLNLKQLCSFVHIGCTSEDINNTAYGSMIKDGLNNVWIKTADEFVNYIDTLANKYAAIPMLAHTHGQPATPTTVGKEFKVYAYRLKSSLDNIKSIKCKGKFNGATGNYSAITIAFNNLDWQSLNKKFVEEYLGLTFNPYTTQIESHDYVAHILDGIRHYNNVLADLDVDMWLYISMEYFKQITVAGEVGSSTMPHKVNPIRFENSESNVDMSNSICMGLSNKLTKSRMQRDLSDSSSQRNLGLAFGYSLQAINETKAGLDKCIVNEAKLSADLNAKWEVLAEPIQTMLRKYGIADAYDTLKALTRGKNISKDDILKFADSLEVLSKEDKAVLTSLTPETYIGIAETLAKQKL